MKNLYKLMALLFVATIASCNEDTADIDTQQEPPFSVVSVDEPTVTYKLREADVEGISGYITMRDAGEMGVEAYIKLENTIEGQMHPVHIHEGLFGQNGDAAKTLNPVNGTTGISETYFTHLDDGTPTNYYDLVENHEYYVGPHLSMDQMETIIAVGDIGVNNPPIPCAPCDGKVDRLAFQYLGSETVQVSVVQKKDNILLYHNSVSPGMYFGVDGQDKKGTLSTEIYILVNGSQVAKIHTSCSVPIGIGYKTGDFVVVDGSSRNGGPLCALEPSDVPPGCDSCDGKVNYLALEYSGVDGARLKLVQEQGGVVLFDGSVDDGQVVQINGQDNKGTLSSKVRVYINGVEKKEIHTSCSQPIGLGSVFGSLEVVDGSSRNGGPLCEI